jgi:glucose-1-phosphate adenylyltransferase
MDHPKPVDAKHPKSQQAVLKRNDQWLARDTLAIIMAGGRGERLKHLTANRCKPATQFGGKFRIIDFVLSNCVNSGIRRISVLTQYKAHSLIKHIQRGWSFLRGEFGEFIEIIPAQQQLSEQWYQGTADALYQNLSIMKLHRPKLILVLAGDHIYKMDYGPMLAFHREHKADITVGVVEVPRQDATGFGVMTVDEQQRVVKFSEKPAHPDCIPGREDLSLGSMGIYVFDADFLYRLLEADAADPNSAHDFGKNILPQAIDKLNVMAYAFRDVVTRAQQYWRDVGTVDAFYDANMEMVSADPELNIYDAQWPIWTYQRQQPPAKFVSNSDGSHGKALDSVVSGGCVITGAEVVESLLFTNVRVNDRSYIEKSLVFPDVVIGHDCVIKNAIIDTGGVVPAGTQIGIDPAEDARRFYVTEKGRLLITREMLAKLV